MPYKEVPWMLGTAACQASSFCILLYSLQPPLAQAPVATHGLWLDNQTVHERDVEGLIEEISFCGLSIA
jgi:hypothetical protein